VYEREIATELIREAALLYLLQEVPHALAVRLDEFSERENGNAYIAATLFVERDSQKGIVIGEGAIDVMPMIQQAQGADVRLDLLARLQQVKFTGGMRSLFEFSQAPPPPAPKAPEAKILPKMAARKFIGPMPPPPPPPPTPVVKPQAPPIPLRFFGYVTASRGGSRRAFFLEGEDIHVAAEGELVKKRYKLVRIGVNSVIMEDTQFEGQQTLPLAKETGG